MGWLEALLTAVSPVYAAATGRLSFFSPLLGMAEDLDGALGGGGDEKDRIAVADRWFTTLAVGGLGIASAPVLYKAFATPKKGKRRKDHDSMVESIDDASRRATTLLAALLPAIGLPIAYISVQALEEKKVIDKSLGDAVQTLIAAGAAAPAIGGVASLMAKVK